MPQPLSSIAPKAKVKLDNFVLQRTSSALSRHVAAIIGLSSQVDHELSLLLSRVIGADAAPALAMYDVLRAERVKIEALDAAAKAHLAAEQYRVFVAVLKVAEIAQIDRHRIAHWLWASSPDVQNALLLVNPKYLRRRDIERARTITMADTLEALAKAGGSFEKALEEVDDLHEINPSEILVYGEFELLTAAYQLSQAVSALSDFSFYLKPLQANALLADDAILLPWTKSETALEALKSRPLFSEIYNSMIKKELARQLDTADRNQRRRSSGQNPGDSSR